MIANIGLAQETLEAVNHILSKVLADEFVLYTKTRKAHWCVNGKDFLSKHKYFEDLYLQLEDMIDEIAERIRIIGRFPEATLASFLQHTSLSELSYHQHKSIEFIADLLKDHETIIVLLRTNIETVGSQLCDAGTADFLTQLMAKHEKVAWMLRSHLD